MTWKKHICEFLEFCKDKNLKLKTSNLKIFAGATLNAVRGEQVVNILPKDGHIDAFQNLKRPVTKTELRSYGMEWTKTE